VLGRVTRYAVLLRGVNVGGHRRVAMADFRALLQSIGCTDVTTYLQSGNAVVTVGHSDAAVLERVVAAGLAHALGFDVDVLVRTRDELTAVLAANPFAAAVAEPTRLHVAFLSAQPAPEAQQRLDPAAYLPDAFAFGDRAVYLWYRSSPARSKLNGAALTRLGGFATARNWNTVQALAERTAG
jgi:uncharacterized protein (DUF1697 family)